MPEPEPLTSLNLSAAGNTPAKSGDELPAAETLQFRRAEPVAEVPPAGAESQRCFACSQPIASTYFHAQGKVVCPACAAAIESAQKAPPVHFLARSFLYGLGAAIAGSALYATVTVVSGFQIALVAILIGFMVGKAIRYGSGGLGGHPQQMAAVLLTYFAITTSFIPVAIYQVAKNKPQIFAQGSSKNSPEAVQQPGQPKSAPGLIPPPTNGLANSPEVPKTPQPSLGRALLGLLMIAFAAPFLGLVKNPMNIISLFIIFLGLQRAWRMTGRTEVAVLGPYEVVV